MAINLRNESGATIRIGSGHWAVYLTLAETFGWRPAGKLVALPCSHRKSNGAADTTQVMAKLYRMWKQSNLRKFLTLQR